MSSYRSFRTATLLFLLALSASAWADEDPRFVEGADFSSALPMSLPDQHGKSHRIEAPPRLLVLTFEKDTGAMVNGFLKNAEKGFLADHDALYIADIARMPAIITKMFALPKMRRYSHTILLAYDEDFQKAYPRRSGSATALRIDDSGRIESVSYPTDQRALEALFSQ